MQARLQASSALCSLTTEVLGILDLGCGCWRLRFFPTVLKNSFTDVQRLFGSEMEHCSKMDRGKTWDNDAPLVETNPYCK